MRAAQLTSQPIAFFLSLMDPRGTPSFCSLAFWAAEFCQTKAFRAAWMEGKSPWLGWGEEAPGWNGRDMIRHPETFPEELKLLLSFLNCYLETMFAL